MSTAISTTGFGGLAQANAVEFSRKNETKVSIPGQGRTTWVWDTVIGTQTANTLDGLAVVVTPPQLDVWPYEGTAKSGVSPYMRSLDGVKAYIVGKDAGDLDLSALEAAKLPIDADGLQPYACEKIPAFGWQTVQGRQKRRAKETSTIAILRGHSSLACGGVARLEVGAGPRGQLRRGRAEVPQGDRRRVGGRRQGRLHGRRHSEGAWLDPPPA
jgi:hypothetical protein